MTIEHSVNELFCKSVSNAPKSAKNIVNLMITEHLLYDWLCSFVYTFFVLCYLLLIYVFFLDVDECLRSPCGKNAVCTNSEGSYQCSCKPGIKIDRWTDR